MKKIVKLVVLAVILGIIFLVTMFGGINRVEVPLQSQVLAVVDSAQKESIRITFRSYDTISIDIQRFFAVTNNSQLKSVGEWMNEEKINDNDNDLKKWFKKQKNRIKDNISADTIVIESIKSEWQNVTRYGNVYGGYDSINVPYLMKDINVDISKKRRNRKVSITIKVNAPKFVSKDLSIPDMSKIEIKDSWLVQPVDQDSVESVFHREAKFIGDSLGMTFEGFNSSCHAIMNDLKKQMHFMELEHPKYTFVYKLVSKDGKYIYSPEKLIYSEKGGIELIQIEG